MRLSANRHSTENGTITPKKKTLDGSYSSVPKTALSEYQWTHIHAIRLKSKHSHKKVDLSYRSLKPLSELGASMMCSGTGLLRSEKKRPKTQSLQKRFLLYFKQARSDPSDLYLVPLYRVEGASHAGRQSTHWLPLGHGARTAVDSFRPQKYPNAAKTNRTLHVLVLGLSL